jgi:hypothetical protein
LTSRAVVRLGFSLVPWDFKLGKVFELHPVDEATANFLQENQLGTVVEKHDKPEGCIA